MLAVILTALLTVLGEALPWVAVYPESWEVRVDTAISLAMKWLINDADLGLFTFKQMTRTLGALLDAPTLFLKGLLVTGFTIAGEDETALRIPPLSWIAVIAIFVSMGVALKDKRLTLFIAASFLYVAFLGLWESAMLTFASIIVVVVIGIVVGVLLGVAALGEWLIRKAERAAARSELKNNQCPRIEVTITPFDEKPTTNSAQAELFTGAPQGD